MQESTKNPDGRLSRKAKVALVALTLVFAAGFCEGWGVGAICPKCLQGAHITYIKLLGIPVFKWTHYDPDVRLSPSWSEPTFSVPNDIRPAIYVEIFGEECRHDLKKDGFAATTVPFLGLLGAHRDGAFPHRRLYQPRIEAVAALYSVFRDVPNKLLATATYAEIDSMWPMDKEKLLYEVHRIQRMRESGEISGQKIKQRYPEAFPTVQALDILRSFAVQLSSVKSEDQWAGLLRDLDGQLGKQ